MSIQMSKYAVSLICMLWLTISCSQGKFMNYESYHNIPIGEKISDVQVSVGRPYEVKEVGPHKQEYIYIERLSVGEHRELFRRYILLVEDDKVVDKKMSE